MESYLLFWFAYIRYFNLDFHEMKIKDGQPHHKVDAVTCFPSDMIAWALSFLCIQIYKVQQLMLSPCFLLPCPNAPVQVLAIVESS